MTTPSAAKRVAKKIVKRVRYPFDLTNTRSLELEREITQLLTSHMGDGERLLEALKESVKLQSHYAKLLNMHDGGQRMTFTVDTWLERLTAIDAERKGQR